MGSCIVYIGDFDLRNENVQAHLVLNNAKILNMLGYHVEFIGINRKETSEQAVAQLPPLVFDRDYKYLELPDTLSIAGIFKTPGICREIINRLNKIRREYEISYVITYQSPTYATAVKKIAKWCKKNSAYYIVNCADIPSFDLQSPLRKLVMKANWDFLHKTNKKYADGVISVSKYVDRFYSKEGRPSVIVPPLFDAKNTEPSNKANDVPVFVYAGTPFKITGKEASPAGMKDRLDKVIDLFLDLSERGAAYTFRIIGIRKEDYLAGVPRHAAALAKEERICFLGKHSHEDTLRMVAEADFSVNYRDENVMTKAGFSTKIVESVSLGTPVVINAISDTFDYLEQGISGFQLFENNEKSVAVLESLCGLTLEERMAIRESCRTGKTFHWESYIARVSDFLKKVDNLD